MTAFIADTLQTTNDANVCTKMRMHCSATYQYKDNGEIDRLLFQASTLDLMMEQWRIKRYDITVMASHRQFTAKKRSETRMGKKSLKHCVSLFLHAFVSFWMCVCVWVHECVMLWGFMQGTLDVFIYIIFFSLSLRIYVQINLLVSPHQQMNCQNESKINWLPEDSITCFALPWLEHFCTPVISVNYKWNANRWKSNLSVCIKNHINQIHIIMDHWIMNRRIWARGSGVDWTQKCGRAEGSWRYGT